MTTVFDIARWFIVKSDNNMASTKLQKLCYYAQAWYYALYEEPICTGNFEAWVHGPVNRTLWQATRDIVYRNIQVEDFKEYSSNQLSQQQIDFLNRVWDTYGEYDGYTLEAMTHQEEPWLEQRTGLRTYEPSNNIINPKTMMRYYRSIMAEDGVQ